MALFVRTLVDRGQRGVQGKAGERAWSRAKNMQALRWDTCVDGWRFRRRGRAFGVDDSGWKCAVAVHMDTDRAVICLVVRSYECIRFK